jgi:hypothetical protein
VLRAGVGVGREADARGLQRGLDAPLGVGRRRRAVERHRRQQLGHPRGQKVDHTTAVAAAHRTQLAVAAGHGTRPGGSGHEVLARLGLVDLDEQRTRHFFVVGVAPTVNKASGATAMELSSASRRAMSWMWGFRPRFSCTTSTPGSGPVALAGRAT